MQGRPRHDARYCWICSKPQPGVMAAPHPQFGGFPPVPMLTLEQMGVRDRFNREVPRTLLTELGEVVKADDALAFVLKVYGEARNFRK